VKLLPKNKIELLPVSLLDQERPLVEELKNLAKSLGLGLGWHYLLDLAWILREAKCFSTLNSLEDKNIVDAGAGSGLLQWHLIERGAEVISVDRSSRSLLSLRFRARYNMTGMRPEDLDHSVFVLKRNVQQAKSIGEKIKTTIRGVGGISAATLLKKSPGVGIVYNQDLNSLPDIPADSQDAVMAVSALEHNSPDKLGKVVEELMRILKKGGVLLATLCAAPDEDWYHEPSQGWCYTESALRNAFGFEDEVASNYESYDDLMEQMRDCAELRDNLADFYYESGDNGMPYGIWDPQYLPVGVCKVKPSKDG
jgi:ubiquinone/menaquinone biosynthesis C-methylase UbiE